jgi:ElaB/YqjD/DUF883 family membrane-anchored ribosome-binding protein
MTSSDPEVIRRQIEDTRRELSYDVDALNEKVNPARVVDRRMSAAKGRVTRVKERVMGSAHDTSYQAQGMASNAAGSVQDAASSAVDTVQQTPDMIVRQTQGNPMAAGLIAFGVGWLVSSLLPATEKEKQLAQQAETAVKENKDALLAPAKQVAQEIGDELKPAAQHAVEEVRGTAQDAAQTVKQEGQSAAQDVQGQAQQSRESVQSTASSGGSSTSGTQY